MKAAAVLLAVALLGAGAQAAPCPSGQKPLLLTRLYFGQDDNGKPIPAAQWEDFLRGTLTPRFADGFTVLEARGQWRDARTRAIARETSKVVEIAAADTPALHRALAAVTQAYRTRFHQRAVGIVSSPACGAF